MKLKFFSLATALVLSLGVAACLTACGETEQPPEPTDDYVVNVTTKLDGFSFTGVKACMYDTEMKLVKESEITNGKASFELDDGYYIATLSGVSEEYSFPSVLMDSENKTADIEITASIPMMDSEDHLLFEFTVFVFEDGKLSEEYVNGQICGLLDEDFSDEGETDFYTCLPFQTENNPINPLDRQWKDGIGRQWVCTGNWDIALTTYNDEGRTVPKHFELLTVTENVRFRVIVPNGEANPFL